MPSVESIKRDVFVFTQSNNSLLQLFLRAIQDSSFKLVIEFANATKSSVQISVSTGNEPVKFVSVPAEVCLEEIISLLLKFRSHMYPKLASLTFLRFLRPRVLQRDGAVEDEFAGLGIQ